MRVSVKVECGKCKKDKLKEVFTNDSQIMFLCKECNHYGSLYDMDYEVEEVDF